MTTESHRVGLDPGSPGAILIENLIGRNAGLGVLDDRIAVLMQSVRIGPFLGHRVRFGADLRCRDADCGTLWMRVDGRERSGIAFDNMMTRTTEGPVSGDQGWTRRSVVLDVAEEAASVHYGFFLKGYGRVWARNVRLDIVAPDVPVTARAHPPLQHDARRLAEAPSNLDFREA